MTQDNSKVNRSRERKNNELYTPFDFIKNERAARAILWR